MPLCLLVPHGLSTSLNQFSTQMSPSSLKYLVRHFAQSNLFYFTTQYLFLLTFQSATFRNFAQLTWWSSQNLYFTNPFKLEVVQAIIDCS